MKKFIVEKEFWDIFPEAEFGILVCKGVENHIVEENKYADYLKEAQSASAVHFANPEFTENPVIREWRDAFYKFRTKKGARCSIEALLKRVAKGGDIGCIIPLVDIYNGISLTYGVPIGGEDIDKMQGNMRLTVAEGGEDFITYGSDKSEPPYPGEIVYKDDAGAICRCFNWRESVRTMLTEDTKNAFMIIESVSPSGNEAMRKALPMLKEMIEKELSADCSLYTLSIENPEIVIEE